MKFDSFALVALLFVLAAPFAQGAGVTWRADGGTLSASTPAYSLVVNAQTGAPQELRLTDKPGVTFGPNGWWRLTLEDGHTLSASDCAATVTRTGDTLRCDYTAPQAKVSLSVVCGARKIDLRARVQTQAAVVTRFALPDSVVATTPRLNRVYFPVELGRSLERPFFERQTAVGPGHWTRVHLENVGEQNAGLTPTRMRDYDEPAVPVTVTAAGRDWLGPSAAPFAPWTVRTPRPPSTPPDVVLLDTPSGPLLSLQSVDGGAGRFVRWGGVFEGPDVARVRQISAQVLAAFRQRPVKAGTPSLPAAIGVVDLGLGPSADDWIQTLAPLGGTVKRLRSPGDVLQSLKARDCWLIVNPDGELLPATVAEAPALAAAIRDYVKQGGVWLLTGGAPFFYGLQPQPYLSVASDYPPAFSDFLHLDLAGGQISLYGVQTAGGPFVPAHLAAGGTDAGANVSREWITWVEPNKPWQSPIARLAVGAPVQTAIRAYGAENGFTRTLADKVKPGALPRLKQSVLLKLNGGTYRDKAEAASLLPAPTLIHVSDYLHGGFDKQYPDHLPPNAALGSLQDFRRFIDAAHKAGHLFMPYTNPTWWCDHPRGPTFVREGEAPLLKDRQGKPVRELYGANDGWSLTTFHPAALAAEQTILGQFTRDYPSDVLFQDQIGARGPLYDFNPASPTPNAYTQGMIDIARRDSQTVPLGTENGFDGLLNWETQFCGLAWGLVPTEGNPDWVTLWRNQYPADTWRFAPLALWLGHDKALFTLHDLGQFVTNRETLAWVMALGYQISATADANALRRPENRQWLLWLAALQKAVGPDVMGAPLHEWRETAPGVYQARYGQATVVSNTTARPFTLDAKTTLAPFGFSVTSPASHLAAGWFGRYAGHDYGDAGLAFVRQGAHLDVYAPPGTTVTLPNASPVSLPSGGQEAAIPPALRAQAPRDRPHPPRFVGVLALPWMTYGWATTTTEQWQQGLAAAKLPLPVRPLTSYAQLQEALSKPDDCLAIVNPYGEHFPTAGPGQWQATLQAIRDYCAHGGAWFETSAYPFFQAAYALPDGKGGTEAVGSGGLALLGYGVADLGLAPPPTALTVTAPGREWLGEDLSRELGAMTAVANRPFSSAADALSLVNGGAVGYVVGVRPGGWGWLWRFGGSDPSAELSVPVVAAVCRHLFTSPPAEPVVSSKPRFYSLPLY